MKFIILKESLILTHREFPPESLNYSTFALILNLTILRVRYVPIRAKNKY